GLTPLEALDKIRGLRHEGLAAWPRLRALPHDEQEERPEWLRIYPARQPLLGTPRRSSVADDPVSTPGRRARRASGWSVVLAIVACCAVAIAALPVPYYSFHGEIRSATGTVGVVGRPVYPAHGLVLFPIVVSRHDRAAVAVRDWVAGADLRSRNEVFGDESPSESNRV